MLDNSVYETSFVLAFCPDLSVQTCASYMPSGVYEGLSDINLGLLRLLG